MDKIMEFFFGHSNRTVNRYYFIFYCVIILIGLMVLYNQFIPAGRMLYSKDMIYGVFARAFLVEHLAQYGSVPMWNPYIFCGLPYVAAIHGDIFYPLSFLKFLMPIPRAIGWTFLFHIFLAGVFAYLTARQLSLSRLGATVVGVAYMFSGWLNSLVLPGHDSKIYVTALFPLVILFLHRSYKSRPFLNHTVVGAVLGIIILSPHPQMAYLVIWAILGYSIFKMIVDLPAAARIKFLAGRMALVGFTIILGMALAAIQFFPAYEYTRSDSRRAVHGDDYLFAVSWSLHQEELFSLIVPEFAGAEFPSGDSAYWGRNEIKDNSEYAGLVALILAVLGVVYYRGREKYFFLFMGAFALIFALGDTTPVYKYLYKYVPLVNMMRAPSMIMFMFSFAVAILAGMGLDAFREKSRSLSNNKDIFLKILTLGLPLFLLAGIYLFFNAGEEMIRLYARLFYHGLVDNPAKMTAALGNLDNLKSGFIAAFILSVATLGIILLSRYRRVGSAVLILIPVLVMADGVRFDRRYISTIDYKEEFTCDPMIDFIREHAGYNRAFGFAMDESQYHPELCGVSSPIGYHGNELGRYYRLLRYDKGLADNFINRRFVGLVGDRFIIQPLTSSLTDVGYPESIFRELQEFGRHKVVEYLEYFPRAYLAGSYRLFASDDSLHNSIYYGADDLRHTVYLDREPSLEIDGTDYPGDTAMIEYYSPDSVVIRASCESAKILTLSDNYHKDWHVYVDGEEAEALITYGTFRGVAIESGNHGVVWKYKSPAYQTGKGITLAAMAFMLVIFVGGEINRRRQEKRWGV